MDRQKQLEAESESSPSVYMQFGDLPGQRRREHARADALYWSRRLMMTEERMRFPPTLAPESGRLL